MLLDAEWRQSGEGSLLYSPGSFRFEVVQLDPQLARPPELSRDVRVREGLFLAIDRAALREALLAGVPYTAADSILPESDPGTAVIGKPFSRCAYDPAATDQQIGNSRVAPGLGRAFAQSSRRAGGAGYPQPIGPR